MSQAVRDLLWVVNCPSFVCGGDVAAPATLTRDDIDAVSLQAFLGEHGELHRVGRYFERLVQYWLVYVRQVELLAAGLQIRDGKRTIGELDFVYRDHDGAVVHCEVAVKFFLHYPHGGSSDFPGPNASDNFELKTSKLFSKQLELSRVHYPSVERREAFVKGMAFYRSERPCVLPTRMSKQHAAGSWMRSGELGDLLDGKPSAAAIVEKPHWLAPVAMAAVDDLAVIVAHLETHFNEAGAHPIMVSLRDPRTLSEVDRMFVVSSTWPSVA